MCPKSFNISITIVGTCITYSLHITSGNGRGGWNFDSCNEQSRYGSSFQTQIEETLEFLENTFNSNINILLT
jgi:hypothetical protein